MRSVIGLALALCGCDSPKELATQPTDAEARTGTLHTLPQPAQVMAFGEVIASVGDLDGDGLPELAATAVRYPPFPAPLYGVVLVIPGDPALPGTWLANPFRTSDGFGMAESAAGDVNGDGFGDLLVGDTMPQGEVVEYLGSPAGPVAAAQIRGPDGPNAPFGQGLAPLGDIDGDGYDDVALASWPYGRYDAAAKWVARAGAVVVHRGSATGLHAVADQTFQGVLTGPNDYDTKIGAEVAGIGDVNGDGYGDLAMMASRLTLAEGGPGNVHVYYGSPTGFAASPDLVVDDPVPFPAGDLGARITALGDVNGDGYADAAFGTWYGEGRAEVYLGGPGGLDPVAALEVVMPSDESVLEPAGDLNRDGYADAVFVDDGSLDTWRLSGSAAGLGAPVLMPGWSGFGAQVTAHEVQGHPALAWGADVDVGGTGDVDVMVF
jgi:hypothetical protein